MEVEESIKLKALSDIASIDISLEFENILQEILKITCKTMNAHSGTLMLVDEETEDLKMVSSFGLSTDYIEKVYRAANEAGLSISSSPSGTVLKTGKYFAVPNIYNEPKNRPWHHIAKEFGFSAQIFTPLKKGLKVIGLLNVYREEVHDFNEEEINFVNIAASQASSIVQNARMCIKLKTNIQELNDHKEQLEEKIKEMHNALYSSERYLRSIIESSIDGIAVVDDQGKIEFGNDSFFNITGWPRDELLGKSFDKIIPDGGLNFRDGYHGSAGQNMKAKIVARDGQTRYLLISHFEIINNCQKKFVFIAKDITEHITLESELKESEAKYRDLFENAQDPMYMIDTRGFFKTINNAGCRTLGASKEEIIGTNISRWLTPESFESAKQRIKRNTSGVTIKEPVVYELICNDGEHRWAEVRTRLVKEGNRIIGIHGIGCDITEKLKIEQRLKESEARYRELFENANDGIYTHDINGFFLTMNDAGARILECTTKEIIGTNISRWLAPESLEIAQEVIKKYISGEPVKQPILLELISKNKKHLFFEFRNRIIKDNDRIVAIHGIARDITEKKMMEQKVNDYHKKLEKSYEELIEADRIKTEFISNITHELLTPLTSIRGFVELLDDETMGKINPEQKKSLEIILRNSDRLIKLIKELLDTLNLDNNRLGLQFGLVSVNNILSKSIQDIYPQANDKQIIIIKDIQPLPEIWGDEDRLVQVIMNLLINAIKFTPRKGKITIRAIEYIEQVKISISDTGIGIPSEKLMTVFDRFYQVDGSSNRKYGGVGLGLSICKSIIDKHYGSIWAQSNGHGSTFHIILPKLRCDSGENNA
ncbi:MAG: hypothetical protein C3F06_09320 [Candidatus Methanoperedenaceae archaeon]|nr:MAG: hypothetical protein C3F06_09320 [Candidatus Methanoperedenaceae archaeon]